MVKHLSKEEFEAIKAKANSAGIEDRTKAPEGECMYSSENGFYYLRRIAYKKETKLEAHERFEDEVLIENKDFLKFDRKFKLVSSNKEYVFFKV